MDRERVIVYIDENTDDGMMWEEFNQEGQMQVSVYDEELEYDVEYSHSIVVKSLQEYLAEHDKQVKKQVCETIKSDLLDFTHSYWQVFKQNGKQYMTDDDLIDCLNEILDKIQGSEE